MSLILCRQEPVTVPLYIEDLGIHLYSSQELCYVIYNNPLLVLEGFIDKRLTEFLRSELRMPFLAERVEKWLDSHGATEEILYLILKECNYYTPKEQAAYRQTVNGLKKLSEEEYEKRRADYFYGLDLFGKAVTIYEQAPSKICSIDLAEKTYNIPDAISPGISGEKSGTISRPATRNSSVTRKLCMPTRMPGMRSRRRSM